MKAPDGPFVQDFVLLCEVICGNCSAPKGEMCPYTALWAPSQSGATQGFSEHRCCVFRLSLELTSAFWAIFPSSIN